MRKPTPTLIALALFAVAGLFAAPAAHAQQPQQPQQPAQQIEIDDATMKSFARAYLEVRAISRELEPQIQAAESSDEAMQIQQQASQRMQAAVQEQELTVERYSQIAAALNADAEIGRAHV